MAEAFLLTENDTYKPRIKPQAKRKEKKMKALSNTKQSASKNWTATKTVCTNVAEFVDAACLATVSGFAIYQAHWGKLGLSKVWADVLLFAGLVIALQAALLLVKHFNYSK